MQKQVNMSKPEFDPTKPFEKEEKPSFDPSKPFDKVENVSPSQLESGLRGAAQGVTMGFADELAGAGESALDALMGRINPVTDLATSYQQHRDESREAFKKAQETNPKTYFGGELAGSVLPAALAPEAQGIKGLLGLGAATGAITGAGTSEADLTKGEIAPLAKDVAVGGTAGGILSLLGAGVGKLASKLSPEALEEVATNRAIKATGETASGFKKLQKADRIEQHGKNLLDKNPYQEQAIVSPFSTAEQILERAQDLQEKSGQHIGDILNTLDSKYSVDNPTIRDQFFNPQTTVSKIQELQSQLTKNNEVLPIKKLEYSKLQDVVDTLNNFGNNPIDFSEAQKLKSLIKESAYSTEGKPDPLMSKVYGILNDDIEQAADKVAKSTNDPQLFSDYKQAKDLYRTAKDAVNASISKTSKQMANNDLGITDYMSAGLGAAAHGGPGAVVATATNKISKAYGNSLIASASNTTSKALNKAFTSVPKIDLKATGRGLIESGDPIKTKLGRVLVEASEKDDIGRNALIFSLMQNPSYRELMGNIVSNKGSVE
jgi:hypothetical protein